MSDVKAGRAYVELFVKDSAFNKGLIMAQKRIQQFAQGATIAGTSLIGAGLGVIAPLLHAAKAFADAGGALDDTAQRVGASASDISTLGYAAEQTGSSMETLEKSIAKLNKNQSEAAAGSKTVRESFAELGLDWRKLANMDPAQRFREVAKALAAVDDPAKRTRLSMDLLGKSAVELNPLFNEGSKGIARLEEEARQLGIAMSDDAASNAAAFGDALDRAMKAAKGVWRTIGSALAPTLTAAADTIATIGAATAKWAAQNEGLVVSIFTMGTGIIAAGAALVGLGGAAVATAAGIAVLKTSIGLFIGGITLLLSPVGLVGAAIVGLIAYTGAGGQALAWLGARFGTLAEDVSTTMASVGRAIAGGDVQLAVQVLWAGVNMEWKAGQLRLLQMWQGISKPIMETWSETATKLAKGITLGMGVAGIAWAESVRAMQDVWTTAATAIAETLDWIVTRIAQALSYVGRLIGAVDDAAKVAADLEAGRANRSDARQLDAANAIGGREDAARKANEARLGALKGQLDALDAMRQEEFEASEKAREEPLAAAKKAAQEAKKAWSDSTSMAYRVPEWQRPDGTIEPPDLPTEADKLSVAGTFSGQIAALLGGGSERAEDRRAKEELLAVNKQIAANTRDMNRKLEEGGAVFA